MGRLHGLGAFDTYITRLLVLSKAEEARMAEKAVAGELGEFDLGDELGLCPRRMAPGIGTYAHSERARKTLNFNG